MSFYAEEDRKEECSSIDLNYCPQDKRTDIHIVRFDFEIKTLTTVKDA
jgi:hypothetical protein